MGQVSRFEKIVAGTVDRCTAAFRKCDLAGKNIPDPGPDVVMHAEVTAGSKRHLRGTQLILVVQFGQVAEDRLLELGRCCDAPHLDLFLSGQAVNPAKKGEDQQYEDRQYEANHLCLHKMPTAECAFVSDLRAPVKTNR